MEEVGWQAFSTVCMYISKTHETTLLSFQVSYHLVAELVPEDCPSCIWQHVS